MRRKIQCYIISTEVENHIFQRNWIFRHLCIFIDNPHWQCSGILLFLCKYYIVILGTLVGSFLDVLFLLLAVIIRTSWETKKERMSYRKKYIEEFVWGTLLFWLCTLLSMSFCCFLCIYSLPLPKWHPCRMTPIKIYILLCVVFCVMISWVNGRKYENLLQFTTTCFFYKQCFFSTHPQLSVA